MKKNRIRLTESDLHRVIEESVKRVLSESAVPETNPAYEAYVLGRNMSYDYCKFLKLLYQANEKVNGAYDKFIKDLKIGYRALDGFINIGSSAGGEGTGFSSNGIGYF